MSRPARSPRRGFLLLEAAVALALLAAAATAIASLASSLARERRAQMQQLTAQLEAENIVQRLQAAPYDELPRLAELAPLALRTAASEAHGDAAPPSAAAISDAPPLVAQVTLKPFIANGIEGQHITVSVAILPQPASRTRQVALELWRFAPSDSEGQ